VGAGAVAAEACVAADAGAVAAVACAVAGATACVVGLVVSAAIPTGSVALRVVAFEIISSSDGTVVGVPKCGGCLNCGSIINRNDAIC
jgi:hypothetical protein